MNYPHGYAQNHYPYPMYTGVAPTNEYLEQRRVSVPVNPHTGNFEQAYFAENKIPSQFRSNSMADAMNFNQYNWQSNLSTSNAPPGLMKSKFDDSHLKVNRTYSNPNNSFGQDVQNLNGDFSKMNINTRPPQQQYKAPRNIVAATGEISCHSNSTIKEEEFDSERDANEQHSDSSGSRVARNNFDPTYTGPGIDQNKQYYQSLMTEEMIKNQKRRESHQISMKTLEEKKLIKSPMKSTSVAWIPKSRDSRTSSMPNIMNPVRTKDPMPMHNIQESAGFYHYNAQASHPVMYNQPIIPHPVNQMTYSNYPYENSISQSSANLNNLAPPTMPDYDYEERRNSGTTGGSNTLNKEGRLNQGGRQKGQKKTVSGLPHNKGRRTSAANIVIPTNDKNVMDYKGQIVAFAKNQQGSKYLQRVLAKASPDVLEFIVVEVGDNLHELMVDSYGNYFCQKLLQSSSSKQRVYLLKKISPYIINIACDKRGTHSMQSLIQLMNMDEEEKTLEEALEEHIINL